MFFLVASTIRGFLCFKTPKLRRSLLPRVLLRVKSQESRKNKKNNEEFLPSEKEKSETLTRALILSSNAYNKSNFLSHHHWRIQLCKKRKEKFKIYCKNMQFLSTHSLTRLDLPRIPSQEVGSSLKNLYFCI